LVAPLAATFYRDQRVTPVVAVVAWIGLLRAVGHTQSAWLTKQMQFRTIPQIEWVGVIAGGLSGVVLAYRGFGVWSLVANTMISTSTTSLIFAIACPWRPQFIVRRVSIRGVVRF